MIGPSSIVASFTGALVAGLLVCAGAARAADRVITIATVSDSTLYGSGLDPVQRTPAKLKAELLAAGHSVDFAESVSLPTTKGGVVWLKSATARALFADPEHSVVILSLGTWDCGTLDLQQTAANLDKILAGLEEKAIPVLIVATKARAICPPNYVAAYPAIFPPLAAKYNDLLYVDPGGAPEEFAPLAADSLLPSVVALLAELHH